MLEHQTLSGVKSQALSNPRFKRQIARGKVHCKRIKQGSGRKYVCACADMVFVFNFPQIATSYVVQVLRFIWS